MLAHLDVIFGQAQDLYMYMYMYMHSQCFLQSMECFDVDIDHTQTTPTHPSIGQSLWEHCVQCVYMYYV